MENLEQPKIDIKVIQETANAAAQKAYLSCVENYYTAYNSPYKKMIVDELEKQKFKFNMKLPDILGKLNQALADEVDNIANNAIAHSFIPMISKALVGLEKEIKMSDILKLIIEETFGDYDRDEIDDYFFSYEKHSRHDWMMCELNTPDNNYSFILHQVFRDENKYQLLSFPRSKSLEYNTMTIIKDDVQIKMPFTQNVLTDEVLNIFFKMMISGSKVTMDVSEFDEGMFPDQEECHC